MDDEPAEEKEFPLTPSKLSKTPSWIMLGFILGALFVWMLPRDPEPAALPTLQKRTAPTEPARTAITTLTTIEAVFENWGKHATWFDDLTEVALWSSETMSFSEFYEVKRTRDALYFRSIPKLTRRIIRHGTPLPDSPLQFTETEEQYREWREHGRTERPPEIRGTGPGSSSTGSTAPPEFPGKRSSDIYKVDTRPPPATPAPPVQVIEKPPVEVPPKP